MLLWLDAQLSPHLAQWLTSEFKIETKPVRELGLREAKDREIFLAARDAGAVVMTKDSDFVLLLEQLGPANPMAHDRQHVERASSRGVVEEILRSEGASSSGRAARRDLREALTAL